MVTSTVEVLVVNNVTVVSLVFTATFVSRRVEETVIVVEGAAAVTVVAVAPAQRHALL